MKNLQEKKTTDENFSMVKFIFIFLLRCRWHRCLFLSFCDSLDWKFIRYLLYSSQSDAYDVDIVVVVRFGYYYGNSWMSPMPIWCSLICAKGKRIWWRVIGIRWRKNFDIFFYFDFFLPFIGNRQHRGWLTNWRSFFFHFFLCCWWRRQRWR